MSIVIKQQQKVLFNVHGLALSCQDCPLFNSEMFVFVGPGSCGKCLQNSAGPRMSVDTSEGESLHVGGVNFQQTLIAVKFNQKRKWLP